MPRSGEGMEAITGRDSKQQEAATPKTDARKAEHRVAVRTLAQARLEQDLQSQVCRATALEQLDRSVEIDVVPHRKSTCRSRLVPGTLELFRTPPLDALDLRLVDQGDVCYCHAVPFSPIALIVRFRRPKGSP